MKRATGLKWSATSASESSAFGWHGEYTIRLQGFVYLLTGVGFDGLPLLALPPFGKAFTEAKAAAAYADKLDQVRHLEPYVSGG